MLWQPSGRPLGIADCAMYAFMMIKIDSFTADRQWQKSPCHLHDPSDEAEAIKLRRAQFNLKKGERVPAVTTPPWSSALLFALRIVLSHHDVQRVRFIELPAPTPFHQQTGITHTILWPSGAITAISHSLLLAASLTDNLDVQLAPELSRPFGYLMRRMSKPAFKRGKVSLKVRHD